MLLYDVAGWTGHVSTSWKVAPSVQAQTESNYNGILFDGETHVLYWADACSEIAFLVPSKMTKPESQSEHSSFSTSSLSCKLL